MGRLVDLNAKATGIEAVIRMVDNSEDDVVETTFFDGSTHCYTLAKGPKGKLYCGRRQSVWWQSVLYLRGISRSHCMIAAAAAVEDDEAAAGGRRLDTY